MKSLLNVFPALAVALLMTACTAPKQPQIPQTPVSVERALEATLDKMDDMVEDETEVNTELDAALDTLEDELDSALNGGVEITIDEAPIVDATQPEATPSEVVAEEAVTPLETEADSANENAQEDELIDQPIIIE